MTGALNDSITTRPAGTVWIQESNLLYSDYYGKTRVVAGTNRGVAVGRTPGEVYVVSGELRWISDTTPQYEFTYANAKVI